MRRAVVFVIYVSFEIIVFFPCGGDAKYQTVCFENVELSQNIYEAKR